MNEDRLTNAPRGKTETGPMTELSAERAGGLTRVREPFPPLLRYSFAGRYRRVPFARNRPRANRKTRCPPV